MSSRRYVEEVKKLVEEEDLDEILLGIPEKPDNFGKRILAKAKYDVVKRKEGRMLQKCNILPSFLASPEKMLQNHQKC